MGRKICRWVSATKFELCKNMALFAEKNSESNGKSQGIFLIDNWTDFETGVIANLGPVYRSGPKNKETPKGGVGFNFCPWCGSDLQTWRTPMRDDFDSRIKVAQQKQGHELK